jgi:uncharacterized phage protein gp47/JayE
MMGFTVRTFNQILSDMILWITSHASQITDMNPGSIIRSFCEATGNAIEEVYVAIYLGFRRELEFLKERVFDFQRKTGTKASGHVTFSRVGLAGVATIPSGTIAKTGSGLRFFTTQVGTIADGFTSSSPVPVTAENVGKTYNVVIGSVTIIESDLTGVDSVTNAIAMAGGVDAESDYAYHARFQEYMEGLGKANIAGLIVGALSVDQIISASVVEHFPPLSNVNVHLYVDDGSTGGVSAGKLAEVQAVIDGDGTSANQGYRAAGVNVVVVAPGQIIQDVTLTISVISTGVALNQLAIDVKAAITDYINGLGVGEDIIFTKLIAAIMSVFGVADVVISVPTANVTISPSQVGRVGTIALAVV